MRHLACILGLLLAVVSGRGKHDLSCFEITNPSGDYVQADSAIPPMLSVTNPGDETESGFFVVFFAVEEETGDTTCADSTEISSISPGDSIEVEIPDWTPEGLCDEEEPFLYFELIGVTNLDKDEDNSNDSTRQYVTSLLAHDVGVTNLEFAEEPSEPPDEYHPGSTITATATLENFGYIAEKNFEVRLVVWDIDSNVFLWHNLQLVTFLDWRGNDLDNPYTCEVTFPYYTVINSHYQSIEARTELISDMCPDDDYRRRYIGHPDHMVEEQLTVSFDFDVIGIHLYNGEIDTRFSLPRSSWVKMDVFDASGRWVRNIVDDSYEPGTHYVNWDGCDELGRKAAAGTYLVRMEAQGSARSKEFQAVRKMLILPK